MTTSAVRKMTAEEFYDWANSPENAGKSYELVRGEVVEVSRPGERHGRVCVNVAWVLESYARQRRKGYVLCNDVGILLERDPDSVRGPDVVYYDVNRRYADMNPKYSEEIPHLVVEVLSPNDRWNKVTQRINDFLRRGVARVWIVDPEGRSVTVYRSHELPRGLDNGDELTDEEALPGFRAAVADFFFAPGEEASPPPPGPGNS